MINAGATQSVYNKKKSIAIFASGAGTNAQRIINFFKTSNAIQVSLIICNNPTAGVLNIAKAEKIPSIIIEKVQFFKGNAYVNKLQEAHIDFIVLAGFLWKVSVPLINAFRNKVINIHPALLPKYGGKGMYGSKVHEAVLEAGEDETGITIHFVDEHYDNGDVIFQAKCPVLPIDTPHTLAQRVHELEYEHFAKVIEQTINGND